MNTEQIKNRDYIFAFSKSSSMDTRDHGTETRWEALKKNITGAVGKLGEFVAGITVIPFNHTYDVYEGTTFATINQVFDSNYPYGSLTLAPVLDKIFTSFLDGLSNNTLKQFGTSAVVILDSSINDEVAVENNIKAFIGALGNGKEKFRLALTQIGSDSQVASYLSSLKEKIQAFGGSEFIEVNTVNNIPAVAFGDSITASITN